MGTRSGVTRLVQHHEDPCARQNARMGVSFGIAADTAQECADGLALLERLRQLGVEVTVTLQPAQVGGHRWIARAVPTPKAPADSEGQTVKR
jgi:hypothetical protein